MQSSTFFFCKHENYLPVLKSTKPGVITFPKDGKKSVFLYFLFEFHGQVGEIWKINEIRHSSCVDVKFTHLCSALPYFFFHWCHFPSLGLIRYQLEATFSDDTQLISFELFTSVDSVFRITLSWLPVTFNLVTHHKLGSLTQEVIFLQFWRQIIQCQCHWADVKVWTGWAPSRRSTEALVPSSGICWFPVFLGLWLHHSSLQG